ncbi:MAG TPA: SDR family NAD(P)-dependent oxidoreductase [Kofleriaceae bacterium]|nr:SDR family NAD(P)-dependent oxidoreductase [Kofleriaceae bacterium]
MTPLDQQTILVTGATDGHGKGVARELVRMGATVLVHGRDPARIASTLDELGAATPGARLRGYRADFASLAEVRALADELLAREPRLDALVNNAGIGTRIAGSADRMVSRDGHELRFAVNYLAPFLLTRLLLPRLRASRPARIINVSSAGQQALDFSDVMLERGYSGVRAYCQSKLAQILFTIDLAEDLAGTGVTANALHPATYMPTKMVATPMSSLEDGVHATLRLISDPTLDDTSGRYFDQLRERRADPQAYDGEARRALRELSERLAGL